MCLGCAGLRRRFAPMYSARGGTSGYLAPATLGGVRPIRAWAAHPCPPLAQSSKVAGSPFSAASGGGRTARGRGCALCRPQRPAGGRQRTLKAGHDGWMVARHHGWAWHSPPLLRRRRASWVSAFCSAAAQRCIIARRPRAVPANATSISISQFAASCGPNDIAHKRLGLGPAARVPPKMAC